MQCIYNLYEEFTKTYNDRTKMYKKYKNCTNRTKWTTRGSNFWSSKEYEGGGPVTHMHVVSLLIHLDFSSKFMITLRNSTFDPVQTNEGGSKVVDRNYEPYSITWSCLRNLAIGPPSFVRSGSKAIFRTDSKWTKSVISSRDHEFRREI